MLQTSVLDELPPVTVESIMRQLRRGLSPLRAVKPMTLSEWAAKHFYLSAESSHKQGGWEAFPFQIGIMDWMSDDRIVELDVKKSKRVGYTKMLVAFMAYNACHRRRKLGLWQPTDDDRDSFVKSEIDPALRDVKAFRKVLRANASEDTIKLKQFIGSVWHLLGGKAARAYRRITLAVALLDEIDGFDQQIEKSSDPFTLAFGRLEGAPFPKIVCGSTPRIKGLSHVDRRHGEAGAKMRFNISCPHCGNDHPLIWGSKDLKHGMKWDPDDPTDVWHVCPHCRQSIRQGEYLKAAAQGRWISECGNYSFGMDRIWRDGAGMPCRPHKHVGVHVWTAYSPQRTWIDIVREFLEARKAIKAGDVGPMQGFVNETLGEVWEEAGDRHEGHALMARAEDYPLRSVPAGVLRLVAGVDVQDDRFELVVWGIGRGEESWVIDYQVLQANPADERDWDKLDIFLQARYKTHGDLSLPIEAVGIDTGGHFTHQVYNFVRVRENRRIAAVKGDTAQGGPIKGKGSRVDVNFRGTVVKRGVKLWHVGTDTAKDLLHGRLRIEKPGPGYIHFSNELPLEFYEQLTSEIRVLQKTASGNQYRWVKRRPRNEVLDCTVYAMFCVHLLDLHRYSDAMWDRLEQAMAPDLFSAPVVPPQETTTPPVESAAQPPPPASSQASMFRSARSAIPSRFSRSW